jgi:hypothetical protein
MMLECEREGIDRAAAHRYAVDVHRLELGHGRVRFTRGELPVSKDEVAKSVAELGDDAVGRYERDLPALMLDEHIVGDLRQVLWNEPLDGHAAIKDERTRQRPPVSLN